MKKQAPLGALKKSYVKIAAGYCCQKAKKHNTKSDSK